MTDKLLLVDFENVQQVDLRALDASWSIIVFVGASQKSVPIGLAGDAQKFGDRFEYRQVEASGRNALDFFIASELGRVQEKAPITQCFVLSKDKGFDPLIKHLDKGGMKCRRLNSLMELNPEAAALPENSNYRRVIEVLSKSEKKSRPRKRKTLQQHIASILRKENLPPGEVGRIIDLLFANKLVSEAGGAITYEF